MRKIGLSMNKTTQNKLRASMFQRFNKISQLSMDIMEEEAHITMQESVEEVPKDTHTLEQAAEVVIMPRAKTRQTIKLGYCITKDPINPKNNTPASQYMLRVHEDLYANHPNGGKAKFLEDPVNRGKMRISERLYNLRRHK